nr:stalk domain-containing protein [uncultured Tyzzerella sp.]
MKRVLKSLLSGVIVGSIILSCVSVFANQSQFVKVSIGSTVANVNGNNTTLAVAPYIQKSSGSMMIPLRFVSTALGIPESNIQYNPNTKEIAITYNGKTAIFLAGTDIVYLNGSKYTMYANDSNTNAKTEIVNGSAFIPLRVLEPLFGFKIDWEETTKTVILSNIIEKTTVEDTQSIIEESNNTLTENIQTVEEVSSELTEQDIRAMEEEVVRLVNEERAKYGLQPLEISEKLMKTAREKSEDMLNNDYYSHTNLNGYNMARELNVSENIAFGGNAKQAMDGWKNSSEGYFTINILDPNARYIGVGYAGDIKEHKIYTYKGKEIKIEYVNYWTQHFSKDDKWAN